MAAPPDSRCRRDFLPMVFFAVAGRCGVSPRFSRALRGARDGIALTRGGAMKSDWQFEKEISSLRSRPKAHARGFCLNGSPVDCGARSVFVSDVARAAPPWPWLCKTGLGECVVVEIYTSKQTPLDPSKDSTTHRIQRPTRALTALRKLPWALWQPARRSAPIDSGATQNTAIRGAARRP